jgi:hypothetical protein
MQTTEHQIKGVFEMSIRALFSIPRLFVSLLAIVALLGPLNSSALADSWSDARSALRSLETYLQRHPTGPGWKSYLQLDALDRELENGSAADRTAISTTLDLLNSGVPGSELPKFTALRKALYQALLSNRKDLPAAFAASKNQFRNVTDAEVQTARTALQQKLTLLRSYLQGRPTGPGWSSYLRLDDTAKELAAGDQGDPEKLYEYMALYTNGHPGLEIPHIATTGRAIRAYADVLTVKKNPQASIHHAQRMQQLSELAGKLSNEPGNVDTGTFAFLLGETSAGRQNPELVSAARKLYSQPNLIVMAKKKIIAAAMESNIDEVAPISDNILGTTVRGTTHTQGRTTLDLRDDPNKAVFDLHLTGQVHSKTIGYNGPAVVYTKGETAIDGHKIIWFDEQGLNAHDATATAKTSSTFTGFGATSKHFQGMIANIASKRAYQNKSTAEFIASQHASVRVKNRVNEQASVMLGNSNREIRSRFRAPLERWGIYPQEMHFSSTYQAMHGTILAADTYQLGAPYPHPKVELPASSDVELRIHESAINNSAFTIFAGRTLTRDYVEKWLARNNQKMPEELQDEEQRDWSIDLDTERPIYITFGDGGFVFQLRGTEWKSGDNTYPAMNVTARYKLELTPAGIKAVRQGDVEIYPPDFKPGDTLNGQQTALKRILTRRFNKILKEEILGEGIQLKGRLASYGKLFVRAFDSQDGWLQAGLGK